MRLVYLALVGVLLVTTVSFAAQQTCDEQMIIKRCEAILPPLRPNLQPPCWWVVSRQVVEILVAHLPVVFGYAIAVSKSS